MQPSDKIAAIMNLPDNGDGDEDIFVAVVVWA
jgi:hypothetical protein